MALKNKIHQFALAMTMVSLLFSVAVEAQDTVTSKDREAAAEAYDRGTDAYLEGNFAAAAHWFERAYRLAPSSVALIQAIRALQKSNGSKMRIANLALRLRDHFPDDRQAQKFAVPLVRDSQGEYMRVQVKCDLPCDVEVDGGLVGHDTFFAEPGKTHSVVADFKNGRKSGDVSGKAGMLRTMSFESPPPPPKQLAEGARKRPVHRAIFYSMLGATVGMGAGTLVSGLNTNKGVDAYEAAAQDAQSPNLGGQGAANMEAAQALLDEGKKEQRRTNILLGITAGMAAATVVLAPFTDFKGYWHRKEKPPETEGPVTEPKKLSNLRPTLAVDKTGGMVGLGGNF